MTARTVRAAGEGERNGGGLPGSPKYVARQGIPGDIMTPERPAAPWTAREKRLSIP